MSTGKSNNEKCYSLLGFNRCYFEPQDEHFKLGGKVLQQYELDSGNETGSFAITDIYRDPEEGTYHMAISPSARERITVYASWKLNAKGDPVNVEFTGNKEVTKKVIIEVKEEGSTLAAVGGGVLMVGGAVLSVGSFGTASAAGVPMMVVGFGTMVSSCGGVGRTNVATIDLDNDVTLGELPNEILPDEDTKAEISPEVNSEVAEDSNDSYDATEILGDTSDPDAVEICIDTKDDTEETYDTGKDAVDANDTGLDTIDTSSDTYDTSDVSDTSDTNDVLPWDTLDINDINDTTDTTEIADVTEEIEDLSDTNNDTNDVEVSGDTTDVYSPDITPILLSGINFCFDSNDCNKPANLPCITLGGLIMEDTSIQEISDFSIFVDPTAADVLHFWSPTANKEITFIKAGEPTGNTGEWIWSIENGMTNITGAMNLLYMPEDGIFDLNFFMDDLSSAYKYCKHYYVNCSQEKCDESLAQ